MWTATVSVMDSSHADYIEFSLQLQVQRVVSWPVGCACIGRGRGRGSCGRGIRDGIDCDWH